MNKFHAIIFTAFFVLCLTGLTWVIQNLFVASLPVSKENWSPVADRLSAILGIPAALAGSIVAIYIAYQSYSVSKRQEDFENLLAIEGVIEDFSNKAWDLGRCFQKLDTLARKGLLEFPIPTDKDISAIKGTKHDLSPSQKLEVDRKLDESVSEVISLSQDFRNAALNLLRNPIAFQTWRLVVDRTSYMTDGRSDKLIVAKPSGERYNIDLSEVSVIAQLFEDMMFSDVQTVKNRIWKHATFSVLDRKANARLTIDGHARYLSFFGVCLSVGANPSWGVKALPILDPDRAEILEWEKPAIRVANMDALYTTIDEKSQFHNVGLYSTVRLGKFLLDRDLHSQAFQSLLESRGNRSKHVLKIGKEVLEGKNIPDFMPKNLRIWVEQGAKNVELAASKP